MSVGFYGMVGDRPAWTTVRDAIEDLPEVAAGVDEAPAYSDDPFLDEAGDRWFRSNFSGLYLPFSEYQLERNAEPEVPEPTGTAISLFSGCGGFDLGTTMAGFETRVFIENDKTAVATLRANAAIYWPDAIILDEDIRRIETVQVLRAARLERGECDLVTGGFPCQPFSGSGNRKGSKDARGNLFYECSRMIAGIQPRAYSLENVPGLLTTNGGDDIKAICTELERIEYPFIVAKLNAVNYGVPQNRVRLFFMGCRADVGAEPIESLRFTPTHVDPDSGMPTFEPHYRWTGERLEAMNEPLPGQSGSTSTAGSKARRRNATARARANAGLFDDGSDE